MPIHHAVLALLEEGDSYGYELRAQFRQMVRPQWGDLNIGHLYQVLERLVRDGLVKKREVEDKRRARTRSCTASLGPAIKNSMSGSRARSYARAATETTSS